MRGQLLAEIAGMFVAPPAPRCVRVGMGAQRRYFAACAPWRRARVVVDNTDVDRPSIVEPGWAA